MSTNTKVVNSWTRYLPIFAIALSMGLILSLSKNSVLPTLHLYAPSTNMSGIQVGIEADAARYTGMAEHYRLQSDAIQRSLTADAERYTGMAEHYTRNSIQRGLDADAARYTGMAKHYAELETAQIQRSLDADANRYTLMAKYYLAWWESIQRSLDADAARYTAMAAYYMKK